MAQGKTILLIFLLVLIQCLFSIFQLSFFENSRSFLLTLSSFIRALWLISHKFCSVFWFILNRPDELLNTDPSNFFILLILFNLFKTWFPKLLPGNFRCLEDVFLERFFCLLTFLGPFWFLTFLVLLDFRRLCFVLRDFFPVSVVSWNFYPSESQEFLFLCLRQRLRFPFES